MNSNPPETIVASIAFYGAWVAAVVGIFVAGQWSARARRWRQSLLAQWRPAFAIAALFECAWLVRGGWNPLAVAVFCEALVGLTIARGISGYEPLPVVRSILTRQHPWRKAGLMILLALVLYPVSQAAGGIGMSLGGLLGEPNRTSTAAGTFEASPFQAFFLLLGGAGIAEETTFRLVIASLAWRLTGRWWLGILAGAVLFGAYHLSPLDGMYLIFWQFPVSQFLASVFIGLVWGLAYVWRGYETAVLGHTLGLWLLVVLLNR